MKKVLLLTSSFPFGFGEAYIEPEIASVPQEIELILIPVHHTGNAARDLGNKRVVKLNSDKITGRFSTYLKSLLSMEFIYGTRELIQCKKLSASALKGLVSFIYSGKTISNRIEDSLKKSEVLVDSDTVVYSYWMDSTALAAYFLAHGRCKAISRAHGADLYDERTELGHLFLRKFLVDKLDGVFPISQQGEVYLKKRTGSVGNIQCAHLGVEDHGKLDYSNDENLHIVSCSNVIQLKRIDLIINALAQLHDVRFQWTHIGSGELLQELTEKAAKKLPDGSFEFKGQMSNAEVHSFIQHENPFLFLNASETEGIPVSIMEALSYGIPVVATDVGGVSELVADHQNGLLIRRL